MLSLISNNIASCYGNQVQALAVWDACGLSKIFPIYLRNTLREDVICHLGRKNVPCFQNFKINRENLIEGHS